MNWISRHTGTLSNKMIGSLYTEDGRYLRDLPTVSTVGELKDLLAHLPDSLPITGSFTDGVEVTWFNVGMSDEHIEFGDPEDDEDADE